MKFPVSREQLRNIKKDVEDEILEHNIEKAIDNIKERIIIHAYQGILGGLSDTKLKIDIPVRFQIIIPDKWRAYIQINSSAHPLAMVNPYRTHFEVIKGKLTELFPDVTFEIDPLKTYILIDWS
jgi:hypothetical protein